MENPSLYTKPLHIRLDPDDYKSLQNLASRSNMTFGGYLRKLISHYRANYGGVIFENQTQIYETKKTRETTKKGPPS